MKLTSETTRCLDASCPERDSCERWRQRNDYFGHGCSFVASMLPPGHPVGKPCPSRIGLEPSTDTKPMSADLIGDFLESITRGENATNGPATQIPNWILMGLLRDKARMDWLESSASLGRVPCPATRNMIDRAMNIKEN